MSDERHTAAPMKRGLKLLLVLSLGVNLLVAGIVAGAALRSKSDDTQRRHFQFAGGPLGQALPRDERRALGQQLRNHPDMPRDGRALFANGMADVAALVVAEPFDAAALRQALADAQADLANVQSIATDLLVARIGQMSAEDRASFAAALQRRSFRR